MAEKLSKKFLPKGIKKLPTGVEIHGNAIRIAFMYQGGQCKEPLRGLTITAANIRYASRQRESVLLEIEKGIFDYAKTFPQSRRAKRFPSKKPLLISEALVKWLEVKQEICAPSTIRGYKKDIHRYLIPRWGHYQFSELKKSELEYWLVIELKTLSPKTINNLAYPLRSVVKDVFLDAIIDRDPFAKINYLEKDQHSYADPFSNHELERLLAVATQSEKNLIELACFSGLSISELMGLAWEDVDWVNHTITIRRVAVLGQYKVPKTYKRTRKLKLFTQAYDALKRHKVLTYLQPEIPIMVLQNKNRKCIKESPRFVFLNSLTGEPYRDSRDAFPFWRALLRKAGLRYRGINQCRHTFASRLLTVGRYPEKWIADYLGHTTTAMLHKHYAKFIQEDRPDIESMASQDISIDSFKENLNGYSVFGVC